MCIDLDYDGHVIYLIKNGKRPSMYTINEEKNNIQEIESRTFHEYGIREREHLQEWISKTPNCLGEELLIIQKEFDGFNDTNERLDLMALDKSGSLVVIENKLDDTGRDVIWQSMKYISYCSTLTKQQIKEVYQMYLDRTAPGENAENNLVEFFDGMLYSELSLNEEDQRMILVAGKFRKEVTSTAMWMLSHGIRIQCIKVTPYKLNDNLILDIEQIIPIKEAEEYIIKMAVKTREEKENKGTSKNLQDLRKQYWMKLLEKFNRISPLYRNVNPTNSHWLSRGSGVSGCVYNFIITTSYASVELSIAKASREENKRIFDRMLKDIDIIESQFGASLKWSRNDSGKSSRISYVIEGIDIKNIDDWEKITDFLCDSMPRLENVLKDPLKKAVQSR